MSGGANNQSALGNWPIRRDYSSRFRTHQATRDTSEDTQVPWWWAYGERVMFDPTRYPMPPQPPVQVLDSGRVRGAAPRPRQFLLDSPPRFTGSNQWNMQLPTTQEEDSKLTKDEQKKALQKLKKEVYNPSLKNLSKRVSLYYRDQKARSGNNEKGKNAVVYEDEGRNCAICLDDFEAREVVTVTPCNHMFHQDCIVPWVKSNGQCPVCRFALCERMKPNQAATLPNNSNINNTANTATTANNGLFLGDLVTIIRAMDEAFVRRGSTY